MKTAYVPGIDSFAIKISPGFFDNPKLGLPSVNGLMVLLQRPTGLVEALLLDNGYLTDVRTAAAGAVAAKLSFAPDARYAAIFGAGVQAGLQLEALTLVRPIDRARIWARDAAKAALGGDAMRDRLGISVTSPTLRTRASRGRRHRRHHHARSRPLIRPTGCGPASTSRRWAPTPSTRTKSIPASCIRAISMSPTAPARRAGLGELHHAISAGLVAADARVRRTWAGHRRLASRAVRDDRQITLCDLTGTGVQDTAIATLARDRAEAADRRCHFPHTVSRSYR